MAISSAASLPEQDHAALTGGTELLPHHPVFRARDLELAREYLCGVIAPHRLTYRTRDRRLDFRHRGAKLGAVELNAMQYGGDIIVDAPHFADYYLLQFMLAGDCRVSQSGRSYDLPTASVAVINPCRSFTKNWSMAGRQLLVRIERGLLERELRAWTGRDREDRIEFDQSRVFAMGETGALTHAVRMLCDILRDKSAALDHPLVRERVTSTLVSALLVELPHSHSRAFETPVISIAPAAVRRAEQFIEENAEKAIGLADVAFAAGVSARTLQSAFRRFRSTTPMAHLRALRLELAQRELSRSDRKTCSVTSVANGHGFTSLSRFASDYKARFHETPSETLRRGFDERR
jgi:AraC-like DNA-binding protein